MNGFVFDLQRFAEEKIVILEGKTYERDGVTYSAITNAELELDADGKISGIASGSVTATVTGRNNPAITFDSSDGAINFTATGDGKVITLTKLFPMELVDGDFIYKGNVLTSGVGSTLVIVGKLGNFSLRNQNTFVSGATYTFSNTAMITDSQHTLSLYTLTNGNDVRQLQLEAFGKVINNFAQRGFTLVKGSSEVLHLGDYTLTATAIDDAALNIELNDKGLNLIPNQGDGTLNVILSRGGEDIISGELECISGEITFGYDKSVTFAKDTIFNIKQGDYNLTVGTTDNATVGISLADDKISFTPGKNDGGLNILLTRGDTQIFGGELNITDGTITFDPTTQKFSFTEGTNISLSLGNTQQQLDIKVVGGDASFKVEADSSGNFTFTPDSGDGALDITLSNADGSLNANVEIVSGSFTFSKDGALTVAKDTELQIDFGDGYIINFKATDAAGGKISLGADGITFAPNSSDGNLKLSVTRDGQTRSASLDVTGAIVYGTDRNISLEKDTVVNLEWEDGVTLKMTASADGGSIGFDQQGLKISGNGELSIDLTAGDLQTTLSNLSGTIHYNAGKVLFDEDSKITAASTLGGQPVNLTLESFGEGGYIEPSATGTNYVAGTGALQITWSRDGKESTFAVSNGNIYIGHGIFQIAEGSELSTDLKDLVPALYFTTTDAGSYTINGQTITTSTENISMTATDNRMTFTPGENVVGYDGMTFTGDGTVSLTPDGVILGAGIEATGFGTKNTFILTEQGSVTVDGKTFELTEDVPTGISVTGAQDGFIFARTITAQSEERLGIKNSPDIGKIFTEEFFATGDDYYRVQTDLLGLQQIIGMTSPVTIDATADLDSEKERTVFDIVTDNEGVFTIGEKPYTISGDSSVVIKGIFNTTIESCARGFDDLSGTVRGDFSEQAVTINGGKSIIVKGDDDIAIAVNANGLELFNVSDGASIQALGDASKVNGIGIQVEGDFDYVSASDEMLFVHGAEDITLETDAPEKIWTQMTGASMTVNDNELQLAGDKDGIWIRDKKFTGLDEGASLTVGEAGTYSTEVVSLDAQAGDVIVGLGNDDAYIYDEKNPLVTKKSTTEEIIEHFKPNETFVVGSESRGRIDIELSGDDLAIVEDTPAWVNITTSDGEDTIVSKGQHVNINMGDGDTWLYLADGKITINGYDQSTYSGFDTNYTDIAAAIERGSIKLGSGKVTLGSAQIDMGGNFGLIRFYTRNDELQKVGYAAESDALDASDETSDLLLFAENYSTIRGGSGDDTVFGNAGDFIDVGDGDNHIELKRTEERYKHDQGATINIVNGNNTITNFQRGFDFESDAVAFSGDIDGSFDGENVTIKTDGGTTILEDIADNADFAQFKIVDGTTYNAAIAQEGEFIDVTDDKADIYAGENSGVDFSGYSGQVLIDLDDKRGTIGKTDAQFFGINQLIGGDGITTLIGSSGNETITAGTGRASIWGNWGNDLMIGNTSADKKAGTEFFMFADDGHDTIDHFEFLTAQNSLTADKIYVGSSDINSAKLSGDDVVINFDGSSDLTLIDAAGKNIQISDMIVKVDTDVEFDGIANTYIATDSNAELTVADSVGSAEIWLNNSRDAKFYGDIRTIDASNVSGNANLGGNDLDNTIIGGAGFNTFNYMLGGGNDLIRGTNDGDVINLGVTLDQISSAEILTDSAQIKFTDGGSLTVDGISDVTYQLVDGSKFSADHTQKEWIAK